MKRPKKLKSNYRDYKNFCNRRFRLILLDELSTESINKTCSGTETFLQIVIIH